MLKSKHFELKTFSSEGQKACFSKREGETRLWEKVCFRDFSDRWKGCRYHIVGIREDIGPQVNGGFAGARLAFDAFICRFLSMQSNQFLKGNTVCVHGTIDLIQAEVIPSAEVVSDLDELMSNWVKEVLGIGGIPIVIGGGHNNAYGLIRGVSEFHEKGISVVNMDPHADTRDMEGRHSGNPFAYAFHEGYLGAYSVLGLHESYNNQAILNRLHEMKAVAVFFESWVDDPKRFYTDVDAEAHRLQHTVFGLELDMDSIAGMPSSAYTPSGITVEQARFYIRKMARNRLVAYLHLPEAAPLNELENKVVGKSLSYLVSDFIKCHSNYSE